MGTRECSHITASSSPATGEAGRTGDWRSRRPLINNAVCPPAKSGKPACFICWSYCPDAVITRTVPLTINMEYCKGCGICAKECPAGAITMVEDDHTSS